MSNKFKLKFWFLGGLGEIGANMVLIQSPNGSLIIDVGILFPKQNLFNVNYLVPDYSQLNLDKKTTLLVTHGHEDHIGGIVRLLEVFPHLQVYAPPFAAQLIRGKLPLDSKKEIRIYIEDFVLDCNDFEVHPIEVSHSIPDTFGLFLRSKDNKFCAFYLSDFRSVKNYSKLLDLSKNINKRFLLMDSTNIYCEQSNESEEQVRKSIEEICYSAPGRVFITMFASNISRIQIILDIAKKLKKRVVKIGGAISKYSEVAGGLNLLNNSNLLCDFDNVGSLDNKIILLSGCQGDYRSAFKRVGSGEDKKVKLDEKDTVIYSARVIPGNELQVHAIFNAICEQGAKLITSDDSLVHLSGHATQSEISQLLVKFDPTHVIPVHGSSFMLQKQCTFIQQKFSKIKTKLLYNGDELVIDNNLKVKINKNPPVEMLLIHNDHQVIEKEAIQERKKIAYNGQVFVSINSKTNSHPNIVLTFWGLPRLLDKYQDKLKDHIFKHFDGSNCEEIIIEIRRFIHNIIGQKPVVQLHII